MWENNKRSNIYVIRVPEEEEKESGAEEIFEEIMVKIFLNLVEEINHRFKKLSKFQILRK